VDAEAEEQSWTALMERSLEGDCDAYGQLLTALSAALRRGLRSRARNAGLDAEDVVQEILLALHLKRNTWVRGTPVAPWVAAIARNKCR
jgi:RNA polymerase sigma-70 factor (ECF subfamily)